MAVAPTYPGVYIEEIPSGVHTITGVATSITAFVGYTTRGRVNVATHIYSYADFERSFGGLDVESPLSYSVKQFFQNGGTEAYVVRVASGAAPASVTMKNSGTAPVAVLQATALGEGVWGNNLRLDVDYATANPASMFNLGVTEFVDQGGRLVAGRREFFRNLTLNEFDASYAPTVVNAGSELIRLDRKVTPTGQGSSVSGSVTTTDVANIIQRGSQGALKLAFLLDGRGPYEVSIPTPATNATVDSIASSIAAAMNSLVGANKVSQAVSGGAITITSAETTQKSSIHFVKASTGDVADLLHLGLANGGTETDGAAAFRPAPTGTTASVALTGNSLTLSVGVKRANANTALQTISLPVWTAADPRPTTLDEAVALIVKAIDAALATPANTQYLAGTSVRRVGPGIQVLPPVDDPNLTFDITGSGVTNSVRNVARYALGSGMVALSLGSVSVGSDGTAPGANELKGSEAARTGLYALEAVDLFNLLVIPDATEGALYSVLTEAIAYCVRRRAFMIIDAPRDESDFDKVSAWITTSDASSLRSRNSALYFPRIREPDPLLNNVVRSFPAAGAVAGLYARTDAERGVWKAPAGTAATISGAQGLSFSLTDRQNGFLNPLGVNCLRTFPVYGTVAWGARTGEGADVLADEYKYIPVRRLALFLEESLYRGTQWVVFEPNDEPLWAQIRLNLGAFMHTLFAQGAFQGRTPREAYFVKCDGETTTPHDRDLGRVNIVVGFAPLKPAEFVIIRIQQIVPNLQV
jgi:phage tail sheath protein FI